MKRIKIMGLAMALTLSLGINQLHAMSVDLWAGYAITSGTSPDACTAASSAGGSCTNGGISFGADLWFLNFGSFDLGFSSAYVPIIDYTLTVDLSSIGGSSTTTESKITYLPQTAMFRYRIGGFYLGAGAGYAIGLGSSSANGVSTSSTGGDFIVAGTAGYSFEISPAVAAGLRAQVYYTSDAIAIVPAAEFTYKFGTAQTNSSNE